MSIHHYCLDSCIWVIIRILWHQYCLTLLAEHYSMYLLVELEVYLQIHCRVVQMHWRVTYPLNYYRHLHKDKFTLHIQTNKEIWWLINFVCYQHMHEYGLPCVCIYINMHIYIHMYWCVYKFVHTYMLKHRYIKILFICKCTYICK